MSRIRVVLQSRMSSTRLPGKALRPVAGLPMVALAAQRAGNAGHEVVVATSDRPEDDAIQAALSGVCPVVRGSLEDPLARFVKATQDLAPADVVVRLTADNVVPDGSLVGFLAGFIDAECAYARLGGDDPLLPYGVAAEAFTVAALREADSSAVSPEDREHVTPRIRAAHGDNRVAVDALAPEWAGLRCTVDTPEDYDVVTALFDLVEDPVRTPWRSLCSRLAATNRLRQGRLLLGTVQLGLAYGAANVAGQPSLDEARSLLARAAACGVTHLDTARAYGTSESQIAEAGTTLGIVTKTAPDTVSVVSDLEQSLRALGRDRVDALLLHRATDLDRPGVREELGLVKAEGLARAVGVSLSTPEELLAVLADDLVGYVQLPFNLLDRRWLAPEVQAALAARPDVIVVARSAYLQGLLVSNGARWPAGSSPSSWLDPLDELVGSLGRESRADLCLAYVLAHPWVTSVVVGAETAAQIEETTRLVRQTPLTEDEVELVRSQLPEGPIDLIDPSRWSNS